MSTPDLPQADDPKLTVTCRYGEQQAVITALGSQVLGLTNQRLRELGVKEGDRKTLLSGALRVLVSRVLDLASGKGAPFAPEENVGVRFCECDAQRCDHACRDPSLFPNEGYKMKGKLVELVIGVPDLNNEDCRIVQSDDVSGAEPVWAESS